MYREAIETMLEIEKTANIIAIASNGKDLLEISETKIPTLFY